MIGGEAYEGARKRGLEDEMRIGRQEAVSSLASGGDIRGALARLIGVGDVQGANAIATFANQQATQAHQKEVLAETGRHNKAMEGTASAALQGKPQDHVIEDAAGNKRIVRVFPDGRPAQDVTPKEIANAQGSNPFSTGGKMQEHEGKSALFADRAATAHATLNKFENINSGLGGTVAGIAEKVVGEGAMNLVPGTGDRGQFMNAKRAFINALLRRESGAAIAAGEFASYDKEYFPQPGDTKEQIDAKRAHRAEVIAGLAREAGKGYRPTYGLDMATGNITTGQKPTIAAPGAPQPAPQNAGSPQPQQAGIVDWRTYFGAK